MSKHENMNSVVDLLPHGEKFLSDRQWHHMSEIVKALTPFIMPERATRFYEGVRQFPGKHPLDQRIRYGTFRGAYLVMRRMMERGMVECKDKALPTDEREFKLVRSSEEIPKRRVTEKEQDLREVTEPPKETPKDETPKETARTLPDLRSLLDDMIELGKPSHFRNLSDFLDFEFHCRHLKRILACGATGPTSGG